MALFTDRTEVFVFSFYVLFIALVVVDKCTDSKRLSLPINGYKIISSIRKHIINFEIRMMVR